MNTIFTSQLQVPTSNLKKPNATEATMLSQLRGLIPLLSLLAPLAAQSTTNNSTSGSTSSSSSSSSASSSSSTTSTYSCIDPSLPYASQVHRGQNTTICLYVGPSGNWNADITYKRFSVNMVADEFSSYRIPGCESSQGRILVLCLTHNFITILLQLMLRKCGRMSFSLCAYLVSMFGGDGIRSFIYTVLLLELSSLF